MIFEKIRERLQEKENKVYQNFEYLLDEGKEKLAMLSEVEGQTYSDAIDIINQVEAEYTCENCAEKGKCAIYDNFNIKFCSDFRPIIAPPPYIPKGE